MTSHPRFIVNPRSGRGARALAEVRTFAARVGGTVALTERQGHASELAAAALADGCELIVAVGGDGTMNEVAATLAGTPATLGLVPCGSGDGLGRELRVHGPVAKALGVLETGKPRLIDSGLADGHPFFTAAGVGFEAEIARRFNGLNRRGFRRYVSTAVRAWAGAKAQRYRITGASGTIELTAFTVAVANARQYGNGARIAPRARLDDGLLDLTALPELPALRLLPLALRLFGGSIDAARGVRSLQSSRFVLERDAPGPLHTDGEIHEAGRRIEFLVRPASLRVMAPA